MTKVRNLDLCLAESSKHGYYRGRQGVIHWGSCLNFTLEQFLFTRKELKLSGWDYSGFEKFLLPHELI
jgi:hypothetical protein